MKVFLDQDQDCHWYMVQADKRKEWDDWVNMNQDDPAAWDAPEFAKPLGGGPQEVEFEI